MRIFKKVEKKNRKVELNDLENNCIKDFSRVKMLYVKIIMIEKPPARLI